MQSRWPICPHLRLPPEAHPQPVWWHSYKAMPFMECCQKQVAAAPGRAGRRPLGLPAAAGLAPSLGSRPAGGRGGRAAAAAAPSLAASMNVALYAGVAAGVAAALIFLGVLVYCCCCRGKSEEPDAEDARP